MNEQESTTSSRGVPVVSVVQTIPADEQDRAEGVPPTMYRSHRGYTEKGWVELNRDLSGPSTGNLNLAVHEPDRPEQDIDRLTRKQVEAIHAACESFLGKPTDLDQHKAMLTRAGIKFAEKSTTYRRPTEGGLNRKPRSTEHAGVLIEVERGYSGFVSHHTFDKDTGALVDVGAWE